MMKYGFGTINNYVLYMKNLILIMKTIEKKLKYIKKVILKINVPQIGPKLILTTSPGSPGHPQFKKNNENSQILLKIMKI